MKRMLKTGVLIAVVAAMLFSLAGCNEAKKGEAAVGGMLNACKEGDVATAQQFTVGGEFKAGDQDLNNSEAAAYVKDLLAKIDYKILESAQQDKDTVVVKTEITAPDGGALLSEVMKAAFQIAFSNLDGAKSDDEIQQEIQAKFEEIMGRGDVSTVTNTVEIKTVKDGKAWKVDADEATMDAMLGGLVSAFEDMGNSLDSLSE